MPDLRWSRVGGDMPSKAQMNNFNQELKIPDVELDDAGEYECTASNDIQQGVSILGRISVKGRLTLCMDSFTTARRTVQLMECTLL